MRSAVCTHVTLRLHAIQIPLRYVPVDVETWCRMPAIRFLFLLFDVPLDVEA